jgi:hypothetical protein
LLNALNSICRMRSRVSALNLISAQQFGISNRQFGVYFPHAK